MPTNSHSAPCSPEEHTGTGNTVSQAPASRQTPTWNHHLFGNRQDHSPYMEDEQAMHRHEVESQCFPLWKSTVWPDMNILGSQSHRAISSKLTSSACWSPGHGQKLTLCSMLTWGAYRHPTHCVSGYYKWSTHTPILITRSWPEFNLHCAPCSPNEHTST